MVVATATKCRAKDPSKCRYHGVADKHTLITPLLDHPVPDPVFNGPMGQAMTAPLGYQGDKPAWWGKFVRDAESNAWTPTTPELLDVIDSPAGPVAVVWFENSQADVDKYSPLDSGIQVASCEYYSMTTGEKLGYVKASSMNEASLKRSFGDDEFTYFRHFDRYSGHTIPGLESGADKMERENPILRRYHRETRPEEDYSKEELRRNVWLAVTRSLGKTLVTAKEDGSKEYVASYNLTEKHIPDDVTVQADLKDYEKEIRDGRGRQGADEQIRYFATPFVDYSKVESVLRGSGFGSALYVYTARKLGTQGKVLRGSGLQSNEAKGVWARFAERLPGRSGRVALTHLGEKVLAPVLDFREQD